MRVIARADDVCRLAFAMMRGLGCGALQDKIV